MYTINYKYLNDFWNKQNNQNGKIHMHHEWTCVLANKAHCQNLCQMRVIYYAYFYTDSLFFFCFSLNKVLLKVHHFKWVKIASAITWFFAVVALCDAVDQEPMSCLLTFQNDEIPSNITNNHNMRFTIFRSHTNFFSDCHVVMASILFCCECISWNWHDCIVSVCTKQTLINSFKWAIETAFIQYSFGWGFFSQWQKNMQTPTLFFWLYLYIDTSNKKKWVHIHEFNILLKIKNDLKTCVIKIWIKSSFCMPSTIYSYELVC